MPQNKKPKRPSFLAVARELRQWVMPLLLAYGHTMGWW